MFTNSDEKQIIKRGSSLDQVAIQIKNFKDGFPPLKLEAAATKGKGIVVLSEGEIKKHESSYEKSLGNHSVVKFVPASGAASRMFKQLFAFAESYKGSHADFEAFTNGQSHKDVYTFFSRINDFAFYHDLKKCFDQPDNTLEEAHIKREYVAIIDSLLSENGLNYGNLPKGLLKFHSYAESNRTPVEEHLVEGAHYAKDANGIVKLHFTVSGEHRKIFESHLNEVKAKYEEKYGVSYKVDYSEQQAATDTIAVDPDNQPFRNLDGSLLFRPAGHGALIANLNEINADLIFIKNIDNVVPDHLKAETYKFKKVLGGALLEVQDQVFRYLNQIDNNWSHGLENEIINYLKGHLNFILPDSYAEKNEESRRQYLHTKLNRPIRTSGMVPNIGDPGGGPFWARNNDESVSLQIVETAQLNLEDSVQKTIFDQSTHFNPVDLACGVKNYKGEKFDLMKFVDPKTGFITSKSKDGKDLKAQELPGLWNGSMSDWITIFIEVPIITFNPVKQVNDLLKPTHQPM